MYMYKYFCVFVSECERERYRGGERERQRQRQMLCCAIKTSSVQSVVFTFIYNDYHQAANVHCDIIVFFVHFDVITIHQNCKPLDRSSSTGG